MRRDPRGLLELRRLAFKAQRSEGAREVLHDALLETFPTVYPKFLQLAKKQAEAAAKRNEPADRESETAWAYRGEYENDRYVRYVVFRPRLLRHRKSYPDDIFFDVTGHSHKLLSDVVVARVTVKARGPVVDPVMFRRDRRDGDVFAMLVGRPAGRSRVEILTSHGHTEGPYFENIETSRPALPAEYAALERAMTRSYGYKLRIVRRRPR